MKVFAGSSNKKLALKIAGEMDVKLGRLELSSFANGEARVWVNEKKVGSRAVVVQSFSNPPDKHIMEFCLICDALHRLNGTKIEAVIPWFGYCIQDKVFRQGEPLSSKVIASLIQTQKLDRIITLDLHNETILGFFDIPFVNLSPAKAFFDYFQQMKLGFDTIVSPDVGAVKKATIYAKKLNLPLVVINKERDLQTGKVTIIAINGKLKAERVLIVDDFVSTGGTLIQTAEFLKSQKVKKVYAALTHHFYIPGVQEKLEKSPIECIFITDSIQPPSRVKYPKLKIISTAKLIGQELEKI